MSLYLACGLTMAIETAYFYLAGFRDRYFLIVCLAVNAATNLTANLVLSYTGISLWSVLIAEILVTFTEFAVYSLIAKTSRKKLLLHTIAANVLSFSAGIILQELFLAGRTAF